MVSALAVKKATSALKAARFAAKYAPFIKKSAKYLQPKITKWMQSRKSLKKGGKNSYHKNRRGNPVRGRYVRHVRRMSKRSGTSFDRFNKTGVCYYEENQGTVTDKRAVYVMSGVIGHKAFLTNVICALLKKLIEQAGIRVVGYNDPINFKGFGSSGSVNNEYLIQLIFYDSAAGSYTAFTTADTTSYGTLATLAARFYNNFENWSGGYTNAPPTGNNNNTLELFSFIMFQGMSTTNNLTVSELRFNECYVDVQAKLSMKIQNRSASDTGSTDAEDVSNQPIVGRLTELRGVPICKSQDILQSVSAQTKFQLMPNDIGVRSFRAEANTMLDFYHVPSRGYFANSTMSEPIRLNPGVVKQFKKFFAKKMLLRDLIKKLRIQYNTQSPNGTTYTMFPVLLAGFEDVIGVDVTDSIQIAFSADRTVGIAIRMKKKQFYKTAYGEVQITEI